VIADALHYGSDHLPVFALFKFEGTIGITKISYEVPHSTGLKQNYPNPFNPVTSFRFSISNPGYVRITVYDILGRKVSTLLEEDLKAGIYEASFDGDGLSSGVYYYRLEAEGTLQTRKMILSR